MGEFGHFDFQVVFELVLFDGGESQSQFQEILQFVSGHNGKIFQLKPYFF